MKILELSDENLQFIFSLVDLHLKTSGLSSLTKVVEVVNCLNSAKEAKKEVDKPKENLPQREEEL